MRYFLTLHLGMALTAAILNSAPSTSEAQELDVAQDKNTKFDRNHIHPAELGAKYFQQGRVVFFAMANHSNFKAYRTILDTLEKIGKDPDLKFIAIEAFSDAAEFYESLSTQPLEEVIHLLPAELRPVILCQASEWAYFIAEFMPKIRALNKIRPKDNPVLVTAIDSLTAKNGEMFPASKDADLEEYFDNQTFEKSPECSQPADPIWMVSRNRERETARNFERLFRRLGKTGKALVRYHYAHLIRGAEACSPEWMGANKWKVELGPLSWLETFERNHPQLRPFLKTILLDETDALSPGVPHNQNGILKLSKIYSAKYPSQDFGLDLSTFNDKSSERGAELFQEKSLVTYYNQTQFQKQSASDLFDGLIYNHDSEPGFVLDNDSATYLPSYCGPRNP